MTATIETINTEVREASEPSETRQQTVGAAIGEIIFGELVQSSSLDPFTCGVVQRSESILPTTLAD